MSFMEMINMSNLIRDFFDAVTFSAALLGGGWLCIVIGKKWGFN